MTTDTELTEPTTGYELADSFCGTDVRVFLSTGIVLAGRLTERIGKYIMVQNKFKDAPALINLDNVSSIT